MFPVGGELNCSLTRMLPLFALVVVDVVQVYKVDLKRDLLYVIGSVPGTKGAYVRVKDCAKLFSRKRDKGMPLPPFPTAPASVNDVLARYKGKQSKLEWVMEAQEHDPFGMHDWDEPEPV